MPEIKSIEIADGLMNVAKVAEYLGVPMSTVYNLSMRGKIPHFHVGKLLRFRRGDVDLWLSEGGCDGKGLES